MSGKKCEGNKKIWQWLELDIAKNTQEITEMYVIFTQSVIKKMDQNSICKILHLNLWFQQYEKRANTKYCSLEGSIQTPILKSGNKWTNTEKWK